MKQEHLYSYLYILLFNILAHSDKNQNLFTGVTYPSIPPLITLWVPEMERARFVSFTYLGGALGSAVCFPIAGLILEWGGWETVFYLFGRYQDISILGISTLNFNPGLFSPRFFNHEPYGNIGCEVFKLGDKKLDLLIEMSKFKRNFYIC